MARKQSPKHSHQESQSAKFQTLFNLEALAAEGSGATPAERELAAHKAAILRSKLRDKKPAVAAAALDLAEWQPKVSLSAFTIIRFGPERAHACSTARAIVRATLDITIDLRHTKSGDSEFIAYIDKASSVKLAKSFAALVEKIESFWNAYLANDHRHATADGLAFFAGLIDGTLGERRPHGIVPGRSVHKKKHKLPTRKRSDSREFTLHPYEVGHAAGTMNRLDVELPRIKAFLESAAQMLPEE